MELQARVGDEAAFVSAGGYHHHIALNTWESKGGSPPPRTATGLYHVAIRYPDRRTLADALRRVLDAGITPDGATDHGVSEAIYLRDYDRYDAKSSSNGSALSERLPEPVIVDAGARLSLAA